MPAESAAKVGGAAPKDRYARASLDQELGPVSCQDRGLAAAENQDDRRLGRGRIRAAVRHHQSPAPFHPGQVPVARLLARGQQAGKGARLRRCGARPCLVKEVTRRGDLSSPTVSRSGPRSLLFNVRAVRLLSLSGVTSGYWPGSASGPAFCFASQISSCLRGVQEAAQGQRSRVRGPKVGCRRTAVCHISAPRPRRAVLPRPSRGGHGGGRKAGPERLCMNAPGKRAIGCVAFQPAAGDDHICCKLPAGR